MNKLTRSIILIISLTTAFSLFYFGFTKEYWIPISYAIFFVVLAIYLLTGFVKQISKSNALSNISRFHKQLIMVFADVVMLFFALWTSFSLRLGQFHIPEQIEIWVFFIAPFILIPIFVKFGLYRTIVRHIINNTSHRIINVSSVAR